jgi:starch synthase (maltosyl-transferring)
MEVALDYALQCSPDHPWVSEHPEWFHHRPDGSIACAENPPKVYQDIYPINFWPPAEADRVALWEACKEILDYWIGHGVAIFRVDNPHTKPVAFWEWLILAVQQEHPEVLFSRRRSPARRSWPDWPRPGSARATPTSPGGPSSTARRVVGLPRGAGPRPGGRLHAPNFWPNTPDILAGPLRYGPPAAFALRLVLAATMSPSYGVYSGYELYENLPASEHNEEYLNSEKYEIKAGTTAGRTAWRR